MMVMAPRIRRCGLDSQFADACIHARVLIACLVLSALAAGCAQLGGASLPEEGPGVIRVGTVSPPAAEAGIVIGKSTKTDVMTSLGPARVVSFDSRYEVWVYRWPGAQRTIRAATELVILFDPSGVVKKTRVRPGYAPEPN